MADLLAWVRGRNARMGEEGSAVLEFIALTLLLLVPLTYLVVTLSRIQAGAFAAEAAAHEAARTAVVTGVAAREQGASRAAALAAGASSADAAVLLVADDFGFDSTDATLVLTCAGACLEPGENVDAHVTIEVSLPGIPGFLSGALPLSVGIVASARAPVDSVARDK